MAVRDPASIDPRGPPETDRRNAPEVFGLAALWRRLKGAFGRPIRLQRRGLQWHVLLVDRRRSTAPFVPASAVQAVADLQRRLQSIDPAHAAAGMRQLVRLCDELRRDGWPGAERLSPRDLSRALAQAELLSGLRSSAALTSLIERLRIFKAAAELREERRPPAAGVSRAEGQVEVSETSYDVFHASVRGWLDTEQPAEASAGHEGDG